MDSRMVANLTKNAGNGTAKTPSGRRKENRLVLSPTLDAICHKAIAKEPKDRYASMTELAQELGAFLKSNGGPRRGSAPLYGSKLQDTLPAPTPEDNPAPHQSFQHGLRGLFRGYRFR